MSPAARRWIVEQLAFLLVLAVIASAFIFLAVQPGHWRRGTFVVAIGVLFAAVLRLLLPPARAGMLVVRSRPIDVLCYLLLGGVILTVDLRLHS